MLNMQINSTLTAPVASQADVAVGAIVRDPCERPATRMPEAAVSSLPHRSRSFCCLENSARPHSGGGGPVSRSAAAAGQMPGPAWGSLVVLKALMS